MMRKNLRHKAILVSSRNNLIDQLKKETEIIVLGNTLLNEIVDEINKNQKKGKTLKKTGWTTGLLFGLLSSNPIGWIIGGSVLAGIGYMKEDENAFKKYKLYDGKDVDDKDVLVLLHRKKVDLEYDTVDLPISIFSVNWKHSKNKVKTKQLH